METGGKSSLFWIFLMLQTIKTDTWHCLCQNRVQIWNRWGQKHIKRAITHDPTTFGYEVMTKYNIGWRPYWILWLWRPQWPPALALSKNEFSMVWSTCVPNFMLVDKSAQYHPKWSLSSSTITLVRSMTVTHRLSLYKHIRIARIYSHNLIEEQIKWIYYLKAIWYYCIAYPSVTVSNEWRNIHSCHWL